MITSVFGALFSVADGLFTGRFIGGDALAAINLIMPVIMIVEALSNMIATGSSVNISMMLGGNKWEEASRIFSFSVKIILIFSCILGVLGFFLAKPFVQLLSPGASETAVKYAADYLKVYAVFAPVIPIYFAMDNYLRVCSKEKLSMIIGVASQGLNIVLDFIVIVVLGKGVIAVAITSCISIGLGSAFMLLFFANGNTDLSYTRDNISSASFFRIALNGFSEFFSSIATSVMSIVMNLFLLKYGGTTAVAAFSVVMYVDSIVGMLNFGICDSLQPSISYCYGAGLMSRVKEIFRLVLIAASSTSVAAFLFMLFAGPHVAPVFIKPGDTELLAVSITAIKLFSFSYIIGWIDMCFSSYFTALDRPGRSLIVSVFGTMVFPIAFLFALSARWGLNGVWLMPTAAGLASGILTLLLAYTLNSRKDSENY
jgi:Na+-driven multidrug efflux pump